jgi:hypothetical protein
MRLLSPGLLDLNEIESHIATQAHWLSLPAFPYPPYSARKYAGEIICDYANIGLRSSIARWVNDILPDIVLFWNTTAPNDPITETLYSIATCDTQHIIAEQKT